MGPSLHDFVLQCFNDLTRIHEVNETLLTLIPKCIDLVRVSSFRPIALCNVVYKVVTKILVQKDSVHLALFHL